MSEDIVRKLAADVGGTITEMGHMPDGSGFAMMSMPLPRDHWSTTPTEHMAPPMPFRLGAQERCRIVLLHGTDMPAINLVLTREVFARAIRAAGRYAYRAATMQGTEPDLDPDALIQNLVVGMLGYWTHDGLSGDEWANPVAPFDFSDPPSDQRATNQRTAVASPSGSGPTT